MKRIIFARKEFGSHAGYVEHKLTHPLATTSRRTLSLISIAFGSVAILAGLGSTDAYATNSTLTMTIDNNTLSLDILPHSANGDFAKSGNSTISVTTNNYSGYTLSIAASSSTDLLNTADNTKAISSISSATSESDFSADTTTAATNYNGKWGYLPSKFNSSNNTSFRPAPGTGSNGHTLDVTNSANATTPNTYTLAIAARVDNTTAPGSYSNTFIVSAVANLINYSITYNKGNTTDIVTNLPGNTTGTIADPLTGTTNVTLSSTIPTRNGYNFLGWCTTNPVAGTGGSADACSGTTIAASGTYNLNVTNNPAVTIYALWQEIPKEYLYDKVAEMSKGTQTLAQLRAAITVPTSADRTQDTSNSGVYEYNTSVFGAASDAASTHKIYYYRGVLENSVGSYGSDGSAATYPNYVILDADGSKTTADTCWRIVRTTGSGGVKMIYNGKWTGSTCANATTNAQVTTQGFNATSNIGNKSIIATGYTFNPSYKTTTGSTAYSTLFGSNTSYSGNSTPSSMKTYIENTWFTNINSYSSILEPSAGYCNDRTIYTATSGTGAQTAVADSYSISTPYTTASSGITLYYFGARIRTGTTVQAPTLGCPRSNADLYTTSSASNGNKQLAKPAALITADEAAFAGSGYSSSTTPYHANSYLRSGSAFWLLSPYYRYSNGYAGGFSLYSNGYLSYYSVHIAYGVRPAISLTSGTTIASGSGTATDPWVIAEPPKTIATATYLQDVEECPSTLTTGQVYSLKDSRDEQSYNVAKLADGKCWLLDNLALDLTNSTVLSAMNSTNTNASDTTLGYLKNGGGTTSDKYATAAVANWTSSISYSAPLVNMSYKNTVPTDATSTAGGYKIGGYYNYCAASAGSYCYGNGTSAGTSSGNATESICPKGWRLPTGNTSGEYQALYNNSNHNTYANYRAALHLPLSGYFYSGSPYYQGSNGYFWSSTRSDNSGMYNLNLNTSNIYSANSYNRGSGNSVRCVYGS